MEDSVEYEVYWHLDMVGYFVYSGNVITGAPFTDFTPLTWDELQHLPTPGIRPHAREILVEGSGIHHGSSYPIGYYVVDSC